MSNKTEEFFKVMLDCFPSASNKYKQAIVDDGEVLETVIIEDVFMPIIIKLLDENKNTQLLRTIFTYFEEICNCEDTVFINIFSITVLEILGNDKRILETAKRYMGPKTTKLQIEADKGLGRV